MHGRKKKTGQISEEEKKKKEELSSKIGKMISEFFEFRKDKSKITDPLEYTAVMVNICPEINTIYNLRREVIESLLSAKTPQEKYDFLLKELKLLLPIMKQNPKSYCLWHHRYYIILISLIRKWCIIKGHQIEKEDQNIQKIIAIGEIALCDQMLAKDERNFHVWNYRSWIINEFKRENHTIVDKELKFIDSKLESNFSNFSALHFKSKTLLSKYSLYLDANSDKLVSDIPNQEELKEILVHGVPVQILKGEFEKTKVGIFMQSQEQSMWLYHKWLMDRFCPIKLVYVRLLANSNENMTLGLLFNRKVKGISPINTVVQNSKGEMLNFQVSALDNLEYSIAYKLTIQTSEKSFEVSFKNLDSLVEEHKDSTLGNLLAQGVQDVEKKRYIQDTPVVIDINQNGCVYLPKEVKAQRLEELNNLVSGQIKMINELFELEPDNRFAHSQLIYLLESFTEMHSNLSNKLAERIKVCTEIVSSSANLLEKNPKLHNKFSYFLKLYTFKLNVLKFLLEGKSDLIKQEVFKPDLHFINMTELAEVLLLGNVSLNDNEVTPILQLFYQCVYLQINKQIKLQLLVTQEMTQSLAKTGALTGKVFKELTPDNEKLGHLGNQMDEMQKDFEEMKRAREEARKQLEARFQDVHRQHSVSAKQNTKDFVVSEGKRINDTLLAFQSKFENQLTKVENYFNQLHVDTVNDMHDRFEKVHKRNDDLEQMIKDEREERLKQTEEQLKPIKQKLKELQELYEVEKNTRLVREKEILQKLSDEAYKLDMKLDNETTNRIRNLKDINDRLSYELKQQEKMVQEFHQKAIEEFNHVANNIEKEMDNRFEHQDKIVDNLSNIVHTFQNTLKVIGGEA